jgi:hypothetical protein
LPGETGPIEVVTIVVGVRVVVGLAEAAVVPPIRATLKPITASVVFIPGPFVLTPVEAGHPPPVWIRLMGRGRSRLAGQTICISPGNDEATI